jgi:dihydropteroate synthase
MKIPQIVGILNITPDSFSDGGNYNHIEDAISHAKLMIDAGANIIDVGAVSTRPNADYISYSEEIKRLSVILPELKKLVNNTKIKISLDSYNYQTIAKYLPYIDIINDVTGLDDSNMQTIAVESGKDIIFMHSMGVPVDNNLRCLDQNQNIIEYLLNWRDSKLEELESKGIKLSQLIFDPGVGFGKNATQSFEIILRINELVSDKIKILVGHSRKSFLSLFGEKDPKKRDLETHITTTYLLDKDIDYIRIHDVSGSIRAINLYKKLHGA